MSKLSRCIFHCCNSTLCFDLNNFWFDHDNGLIPWFFFILFSTIFLYMYNKRVIQTFDIKHVCHKNSEINLGKLTFLSRPNDNITGNVVFTMGTYYTVSIIYFWYNLFVIHASKNCPDRNPAVYSDRTWLFQKKKKFIFN